MGRAPLLKLIGAFLAGLVIALASAVIYVRVQERQPAPAAQPVEEESTAATNVPSAPAAQPSASTPSSAAVQPPPDSSPEASSNVETAPKPEIAPLPRAKRSKNDDAADAPPPSRTPRVRRTDTARPLIAKHTDPPPPVQIVQNTSDPLPAAPSNQSTYPPVSVPPSASPSENTPVSAAPPAPQPHVVELAAGTQLAIRLTEQLSTENNYTGDTFRGTLDQPLIREGFIIAEKGSKVLGRITDATPAGRVRGVSSLAVTLTEINTTDGQHIHINTNSVEKRGQTSTGTDAAKIAGGAALGAIIGALGGGGKGAAIGAGAGGAAGTGVVLATRGKATTLPNESLLTFQLAEPVTITEKMNR